MPQSKAFSAGINSNMRRFVVHAVAALFVLAPLSAAAGNQSTKVDTKGIVLGAGYGLAPGDFGYLVVDVADGEVVAERNADQAFMPASVAKIVTTAAALEILGHDHRFETTISIEGPVAGGVLDGALTIRGGGDPLLTGDDLKSLAQQIARAGITKVVGGYHYDATDMVETPRINANQPEAVGYNPGVSPLSVNFNRVRVKWRNGKGGPSAEALAISDHLTMTLDAVHFAAAEEALPGRFVRAGEPSKDSWLLSRELAPKGEDWLPVGNPALLSARMLRLLAAEAGVTLPEPTPLPLGAGAKQIARHQSVGLSEIVREVLRHSNNMAAELVGLATSRTIAVGGRPLSLEESAGKVSNWWRSRLATVDWDGFVLENHSGLSSKSRATPRQLVAILEHAAQRKDGDAGLRELLRAASWKAPNGKVVRIRAKTGTIAYGRGLAGYIEAANGRQLAFAVFFNDLQRRAAIDARFDPRAEANEPEGRPWRNRALKLEEMLLNGWATGSWR
jgi:D-alanyl-D-alanine carboxypeptidase/D-alanyl-D-alanine-endopeptidase (penicillin-binding protein 4)